MAAKRSPILGYNHNVRYRGVVFHVQTEDSGITNPHVFTHLFHGGVILSTRKLVYDNEASEEAVKALMQSQHKAVLRDLKNNAFDDKIDQYLAGTPGLLPRGFDDAGAPAEPATQPVPKVEPGPDIAAISRAPTETSTEPPPRPAMPRTPTPAAAMPPIPPRSAQMAAVTPPPGLAGPGPVAAPHAPVPAPPVVPAIPPTRQTQPRSAMAPPVVVTRTLAEETPETERREVSQAFAAIHVPESGEGGELAESGDDAADGDAAAREFDVPGTDPNAVAEIHSPAPPSAAVPPGAAPERPGSYAQHKRRESGPMIRDTSAPPVAPPAAAAPVPQPPPGTAPARRDSVPPAMGAPRPPQAAPPGVVRARPPTPARPGTVQGTPPARAGVPPAATVPRVVTPPAFGRTATPPTSVPRAVTPGGRPATTPPPRQRPPSGGGVVMSKPAVIVGAPPKVIGGAGSGPAPAPPPAATAAAPPGRGAPPRVRKAREDEGAGVFGQDLISEKSLDEVILAYLSEDGSDE